LTSGRRDSIFAAERETGKRHVRGILDEARQFPEMWYLDSSRPRLKKGDSK